MRAGGGERDVAPAEGWSYGAPSVVDPVQRAGESAADGVGGEQGEHADQAGRPRDLGARNACDAVRDEADPARRPLGEPGRRVPRWRPDGRTRPSRRRPGRWRAAPRGRPKCCRKTAYSGSRAGEGDEQRLAVDLRGGRVRGGGRDPARQAVQPISLSRQPGALISRPAVAATEGTEPYWWASHGSISIRMSAAPAVAVRPRDRRPVDSATLARSAVTVARTIGGPGRARAVEPSASTAAKTERAWAAQARVSGEREDGRRTGRPGSRQRRRPGSSGPRF